jgi:hypothetical protein
MEDLSIKISAADVAMLRRIARAQHRRFDDFMQLVFATGLEYYFGEDIVYVDKLPEEYTEKELKQLALNAKIKKENTSFVAMEAAGHVEVKNYLHDLDGLIEPIAVRVRGLCLD